MSIRRFYSYYDMLNQILEYGKVITKHPFNTFGSSQSWAQTGYSTTQKVLFHYYLTNYYRDGKLVFRTY